MPTKEKQLPHAHSVNDLIRGLGGIYIRGLEKPELKEIERQIGGMQYPMRPIDTIEIVLNNMNVRSATRVHAVADFLLESPKRGYISACDATLHELFNFRNESAARQLLDAANERDILDLQTRLSRVLLEEEYYPPLHFVDSMELTDINLSIESRLALRVKIRERVTPSTPQTRA